MRWACLILVLCFPTFAIGSPHDEARKLIATGAKQQAWDLLYPLAAQEQDARAQVMLGQMLLSSPEVPDNEEKALRMFRAAERNGHPAASRFISMAEQQKQFSRQAESRVARAKDYYARAQKDYEALQSKLAQGFLDGSGKIYSAKVDVFIDSDSSVPKRIERLIEEDPKLSEEVLVTYYVVFDRSQIGSANPFTNNFNAPDKGLEPDIDGSLAGELGIDTFPAIALRTAKNRDALLLTFDRLASWAESRRDQ